MRDVTAPDGRTLRVHEAGAADGPLVLVHQGTPMSGLLFEPHAIDAARRGVRLVAYDRPGYGGSTPAPGRSVADSVEDVRAIADALGAERLVVGGISGGGPHALACAALLPDRVAAVASLASVAPIDAEGLDWLAGMGELNLDEFAAARQGRAALEAYLEPQARATVTAEGLLEGLRSLLSDVDAAVLTGDLGDYLAASMREATQQGVAGWRDDDLAFDKPWGFSVEDIRVPVLLWHGEHDRFVPLTHGQWLAARIPDADARLSAEDGHLTLMQRRVPEVHEWLLERF
ncbi:MAG: alpha/beta hydrolase [Actinobacteria bacterium]|nr:MAG: alpha/beta hydrolase [Actinomycetota bacterium]